MCGDGEKEELPPVPAVGIPVHWCGVRWACAGAAPHLPGQQEMEMIPCGHARVLCPEILGQVWVTLCFSTDLA